MRGSLWRCSQLQCKLATTEESRGLEIQNQLLGDMKAEFQEFPGRRVYTDVSNVRADRPPAAPRAAEEEEDRASALMATVPLMASLPPYSKMRLQHHRFLKVISVFPALIALIARCHLYNAYLRQKQRNKYKRLKVIIDWIVRNKIHNGTHLKI